MRWLAVLLILALAGCTSPTAKAAPDRALAGELVSGGQYDPASYQGRVTVVNFWGSWCPPCRAETPELVAAHDALGEDVAFLGINIKDPDRDKAAAFVESYKIPYPSIFDPPGKLALAFDVPPSTIPTTLILRKDGTVATEFRQAVLRDTLVDAVRKVVADG